ncbi:MAG: hypothetical protein E6J43_03560 [Chloroflexi bacterium]|nr:MAG: hypothetical protein E6J43_03560 [Chloroflexota bacterium]
MAIRPKAKRNVHEYAEDLMQLVRSHFLDAEFELQRARAKDYALVVKNTNLDDLFDLLPLTAERTTDILVESGIHIHVLPEGRIDQNPS